MCYNIIRGESLKEVYKCIEEMLRKVDLSLDDSNKWKETIEIHLPDPDYQLAFGSIQYLLANKTHKSFLELRFKRQHLKYVGMLEKLDAMKDNPFRNDAKTEKPEAIRFHFCVMDDSVRAFITQLGEILAIGMAEKHVGVLR